MARHSAARFLRKAGAIALAALLTTASAHIPDPPQVPMTAMEARVLAAINDERADRGLAKLTPAPGLVLAARAHAKDMAENDFLDHRGSDGAGLGDRAARAGYGWSRIAENIAAGEATARATVEGWMGSAPHRRNMLNPALADIGIGHVYRARDPGRLRYGHYWVAMFGRRR